MLTIDLNADLGEGVGDDIAMLDVVTSANIACGAHAGDPASMRSTVRAAVVRGIAIGAHVSYADREGFGRRAMDIEPARLRGEIAGQIALLAEICRSEGGRVRYVKPHGALYHRIGYDEPQARAVIEAVADVGSFAEGAACEAGAILGADEAVGAHVDVRAFAAGRGSTAGGPLALLGMPGSLALRLAAEHSLPAVTEAFADRAYATDGTLVPRGEPGAVLSDSATVAARALGMARAGSVVTATGSMIAIDAKSLCVHGDSPGAVAMARAVRAALDAAGIGVAAFTGPFAAPLAGPSAGPAT